MPSINSFLHQHFLHFSCSSSSFYRYYIIYVNITAFLLYYIFIIRSFIQQINTVSMLCFSLSLLLQLSCAMRCVIRSPFGTFSLPTSSIAAPFAFLPLLLTQQAGPGTISRVSRCAFGRVENIFHFSFSTFF